MGQAGRQRHPDNPRKQECWNNKHEGKLKMSFPIRKMEEERDGEKGNICFTMNRREKINSVRQNGLCSSRGNDSIKRGDSVH